MIGTERVTPPAEGDGKFLLWAAEIMEEGENFLKAQPGYDKIDETMRAVMSDPVMDVRSPQLSDISCNILGKIALDMSAALTDVRPFWSYKTFNKEWEHSAQMFDKLSLQWWMRGNVAPRFTDAIKYFLVAGTGYLHVKWDTQKQELGIEACDPRDVIPLRPNNYASIQDAYGVVFRQEKTVNFLKSCYPDKEKYIVADRDGSTSRIMSSMRNSRFGKYLDKIGVSPFREKLFGNKPKQNLGGIAVTDLYTLYVKDDSTNDSGETRTMGESNWAYDVKPGDRLYPYGRAIVYTRTCVLEDGPNPYWHSLFPFVKITLDPWPWSWLGSAPLWAILDLQKAYNKTLRMIDDHWSKVARPDVIADKNSVPKAQLERIDTRRSGLKLSQNPTSGKGIQIVPVPPLEQAAIPYLDKLEMQMNTLSGCTDLTQISQLNQIPSAETVEKLMETQTPSVRLRSRALESAVAEFAMMVACNFAQFYDTKRRFAILGPEGLVYDDFDFDPGTLIPDTVYDHFNSNPEKIELTPENSSKRERAKAYLRGFAFYISPSSLLNSASMSRKLMYLQLFRAGVLDPWTLLEVLEVPNVGQVPGGAVDIMDRLKIAQQQGFVGAVSAAGRKSSGQAPPMMKNDGTISESGT